MKKRFMRTIMMIIVIIFAIVLLNVIKVNKSNSDDKFNILTSFYPIYIATLNITEGASNITVSNLTNNVTECLHDYTLSTEEIVAVSNADALVINGAGMEEFVANVVDNYEDLQIIDSSSNIELIKEEHNGEQVINSHLFVSISNYINQVENITEDLIRYNPENKGVYKSNAEKYIIKLNDQRTKMEESLKNVKNKNIVTFHSDFEYFAKDFNLNIVGLIEGEHGAEPSAANLIDTISVIKEKNVKAIFASEEYSVKVAQAISNETNAKVYILNSVVAGKTDKNSYIDIMEENLQTLILALN